MKPKRYNYKRRKPAGPRDVRPEGEDRQRTPFKPHVSSKLKPILDRIGIPEQRPFKPDPFQLEALKKLELGDVIVSAPTGSGKTWIAVEAMAKVFKEGGRSWYASPLKALSNSKYIEFCNRFGEQNVGLLTGDHKVNADAPIVVGTTEILRNQLYDAMSMGEDLSVGLVVMDEAHYLGDPDRGVVWEEVAIYLPTRIRLLLLSATVANARQLAGWLTHIRGIEARAVITEERPVPLHPLFLFSDGRLISLTKGRGLSPEVRLFIQNTAHRRRRIDRSLPLFGRILKVMASADILPAIFFLKSRADCDLALNTCQNLDEIVDLDRRMRLEKRLDELLDKYPFLKTHSHLRYVRRYGVAAHHAGHLPHWKLLIEQLMQEGLLTAIFSTSTVAAGVNFPARTVVVSQSDRFNGREFVNLSATDLLQMTGRAGRRGMDRIGFAMLLPGPFLDVQLVHDLLHAPPDQVISQIHINFSMALNLLMSHPPEQIKHLLSLSLADFQQSGGTSDPETAGDLEALATLVKEGRCRDTDEALLFYEQTRRLEREAALLKNARPRLLHEITLTAGLEPGRLFEVANGQRYCYLQSWERHGRDGVLAAKVKTDLGLKKGQVRQKWVDLSKISALLDTRLDINEETRPLDALSMIQEAAWFDHDTLDPKKFRKARKDPRLIEFDERVKTVEKELASRLCVSCPVFRYCLGSDRSEAFRIMNRLYAFDSQGFSTGRSLWSTFLKHLNFLKKERLVGPDDELTNDGRWAANLRLDHPLLIAEGIRTSAWPEDDPALLAGVVAPFVVDKEILTDAPATKTPPELAAALSEIDKAIGPISNRLQVEGFETPRLNRGPSLAVYSWATVGDWDEAVRLYGFDQGDMAMLVYRTADNLRQMASLVETHPKLGPAAREAITLIMKEPVTIPL